ncbi:TatD family hydrolase [Coraliomargarita sp. SDUM461003]|uniref:TatD family hydrolase n=1 Tax=Thalassobacterium maritimum TaxID=3041265 RepID=A0ABU1AVE9_9BACT|nr:TatD family hydrolase [Coraliomargarita sp. SDUM461003]MDQ8207632.1 TatD family hydrolase [Coraliomargarita sp. SDUM461003]
MKLYDAHCHLFGASRHKVVVNGTCPADWREVIEFAEKDPQVISAIGLHPWQVQDAPSDWQASFFKQIDSAQAVGEIGLDQWIEGYDIERQQAAFSWQLEQAAQRNLPVSIHCLKASDSLLRILKTQPCPKRGIHLHAYSGSAEQVSHFAQWDAYFSFHAGQLGDRAQKAPAALQAVPIDRLLIESDAPDTIPSSEAHATFLLRGYQRAAELRGLTVEALAEQVAANFKRYFLYD